MLGRMLYVDVPLEIAQYAEGQRIVAAMVLMRFKTTTESGAISVMLTEPKGRDAFRL